MLVGGVIVSVTGIIALVHHLLRSSGKLPGLLRNDTLSPRAELIVAPSLIVVGVLLLAVGA
jgi:hypothetical protein